ncbi:hypothetical protein [Maribacter sp. 2-571]|uniref:hypothetical protein n=1 Tax=Maribacter sp. 2-571 TaxID=3417569 RepID=UPI003D357D6A
MNGVVLFNIFYFALPLLIVGVLIKYVLKLNVNMLLPSAIMLVVFILVTSCSPFTSKQFETELYTIFCIVQLVALAFGIFLMSRQRVPWKHFFVSLCFQFFYWIYLFYYGGLQFTHKFDV